MRNRSVTFILSLLLLSVHSALPAYAQDSDDDDEPCTTSVITDYVIEGSTIVGTVVLHEFGHFVVAKMAGSQEVYMDFTPFKYGPTSLAATLVDPVGLTDADFTWISIAGVGTTRLMAEGADLLSKQWDDVEGCPSFGRRLTSAFFIKGRLDFPLYVVTNMFMELASVEGGDMSILISSTLGDKTTDRILGYGGLLLIAGVDLWFDRERLFRHLGVTWGVRQERRVDDVGVIESEWRLSPVVSLDGFGLYLSGRW
jgi:hypothetical protein